MVLSLYASYKSSSLDSEFLIYLPKTHDTHKMDSPPSYSYSKPTAPPAGNLMKTSKIL